MNYQRIYNELIADRRANPPADSEYVEVHHILPRCMGGGDEPENLIPLRPEDHFFAHLLLAKIHGGRLWAAVHLMAGARLNGSGRVKAVQSRTARKRYSRLIKLARAQQRGANHPTSDKTVYDWENIDGRKYRGARYEFRSAIGVDNRGIDNVLTGYAKTVQGWYIPDLLSEGDLQRFRAGRKRKPRDTTVYNFKHADGREFEGDRQQFADYAGISRQMAERLLMGGCHTASGWYLPALNPNGIDGKHYYSGDRAGTAIKTVYHFRRKSGEEFIGTRMALVERYGLNRQAVHNMAVGVAASSGGWFMLKDDGTPVHAANDNIAAQGSLPLTA